MFIRWRMDKSLTLDDLDQNTYAKKNKVSRVVENIQIKLQN